MKNGFFENEGDFQEWVVSNCESYAAHPQPITGDPKYPGIPDLSIGMFKLEVWAELKCWTHINYVHDPIKDAMKRGRKLTAQQREWLKERERRGGSLCGVLVAWRTGHNARYVSFVPIRIWDNVHENWGLAALALSPYTERLEDLLTGKSGIPSMIRSIQMVLMSASAPGAYPGASRTTNQ